MARTGRRPGKVDTRQAILDVARTQFAEQGYDAVSLRGVARAAGVDPALVHHYFAGKSGLFAEVMQLPIDPSSVIPLLLEGDRRELGERIIRFFLGLWDSPRDRTNDGCGVSRSPVAPTLQRYRTGELPNPLAPGDGLLMIWVRLCWSDEFMRPAG